MSLAKKYDKRLRNEMSFRAVWPPGTNIALGDVLVFQNGVFHPVAGLKDFDIPFTPEPALKFGGLRLNAVGVRNRIIQGGADVSLARLDLGAKAELRIAFSGEEGYFLRTPDLTGTQIDNLLGVANRVSSSSDWKPGKYFIAHTVYHADEFVFLGSKGRNRSMKFSGAGKAIVSFLTLGLAGGLERTSAQKLTVEIIGQAGPVAVGVARIKRNGEIEFR